MKDKKYWTIDLGTTNSAIAWSNKDRSEIIRIDGKESIPSVIIVKDGNMAALEMRNKKLYTNLLETGEVTTIEEWKVDGMATTELGKENFDKKVPGSSPIKLSSLIIERLIKEGEHVSGEKIKNLAITVPANFSEAAKLNTISALRLAKPELESVKLIHEPTAAAMSLLSGSYNVEEIIGKKVMVFDMGGGTTDISIVEFGGENGAINANVRGTSGTNTAGKTIDGLILNDYIFPIITKQTGLKKEALKNDEIVLHHLMYIAEWIKIQLANEKDDASTNLKFHFKKKEYKINLDVSYKKIIKDLRVIFKNLLFKTNKLIGSIDLTKKDIDFVVTAGGSSMGPWVTEIINDFFAREIVKNVANPETAIAVGGSIISAINFNQGIFEYRTNQLVLNELTPNNIGLEIVGGKISWMIDKDQQIPVTSKVKHFHFTDDSVVDQNIEIYIYENKKKNVFITESTFIGIVEIKNNNKSKEIDVAFKYGADNSLHIVITQADETKEYKVLQSGELYEEALKYIEGATEKVLNSIESEDVVDNDVIDSALELLDSKGTDISAYKNIKSDPANAKKFVAGFIGYINHLESEE